MFIISKNKELAYKAIQSMLNGIKTDAVKQTNIYEFLLMDNIYLIWVGIKPSDNLHIYKDGFVIGKLSFNEKSFSEPIHHNKQSIDSTILHPLLYSIIVKIYDKNILIKPNQHSNIFYSKNSISDFQLLIAKTDKLLPSLKQLVMLGSIGYFPGNLTLFDEILKIPYLETLYFPDNITQRYESFNPKKWDDNKMINRLLEIIPNYKDSTIALSSGLDSRFVLGLLHKKDIKPKVYTSQGDESLIVDEICQKGNYKLSKIKYNLLDEYTYTLISDGRIYFRGGNFSQMFDRVYENEILHNGLWSDPIIENAMKSAWKKPGKKSTIYNELIWYALLGNTKQTIKGYVKEFSKEDLYEELKVSLEYGKLYTDFDTRKQWAGWFYLLHRGLNWTDAVMADVSLYIYPIYVLGDKEAIEYGITSSAYSNFYKERLRVLNRKLLPHIDVDYSDARSFYSLPPLIKDIHKIYYEYPKRFFYRWKTINKVQQTQASYIFDDVDKFSNPKFKNYFSKSINEVLYDNNIPKNTKRVAVTLNNILNFLEK